MEVSSSNVNNNPRMYLAIQIGIRRTTMLVFGTP